MALYEVIYGQIGCGKSSYALSIINPSESFKFGNNHHLKEWLLLEFGSIKRHEDENRKHGLAFKRTTLSSIVEDIESVSKPTLVIDEWTTFSTYSLLWPQEKIKDKINDIFGSIDGNKNLERAVFISSDYMPFMPFKLYKKRALWNKELFRKADSITKIEYGIPIKIK